MSYSWSKNTSLGGHDKVIDSQHTSSKWKVVFDFAASRVIKSRNQVDVSWDEDIHRHLRWRLGTGEKLLCEANKT
jgi:hypothetical protein